MKQRTASRLGFASVIAGLLIVLAGAAALYFTRGTSTDAAPPLAGAPIGGAFALTDQDGNRVTNDSLKGDYRLIYFGYTYCPDVCPVDVQRMAEAYRMLEASDPELADNLTPVFVTVDPERDTQAVVGEFVSAFHPDLVGLTGTREEVDQAIAAYRIYAAKGSGTSETDYLMDHSANIYLMDETGEPITFFGRDMGPEAIAQEIRHWMS